MNHEDECSPNPQLDHNLVNIKDYSQNDQSDPEEEDSPFDQLEHILEQDDNRTSRNEYRLAERVQELEAECRHLKFKCAKLSEKVTDLNCDLSGLEEVTRDDPETDPYNALQSLETQLTEFKQSFEEYRTKHTKAAQQKDAEISKLKQELERIHSEKGQIQSQRNSLLQTNEELTHSNESLILQIQQLQMDLAQSRTQIQSSRSHRMGAGRRDLGFESEVQAQLQILIQKLMAELQLQRGQKRRLNEQLKMMQKETMLLEKEITAKNNKIYQLEMHYLKNGRNQTHPHHPRTNGHGLATSFNQGHRDALNQRQRQIHLRGTNEQRLSKYNNKSIRNQPPSKSDRPQSSSPRSRTLMQILNNDDMQDRDRLMLAVRLIDFFTKKILAKEYLCYELESLLIGNFSKAGTSPSLITVRKNTASSAPQPTDSSYDKMICNLGEILDVLLGGYLSEVKTEDSNEEYALGLIGDIVTQKEGVNLNDVNVIKHLLEDCLKDMEEGKDRK